MSIAVLLVHWMFAYYVASCIYLATGVTIINFLDISVALPPPLKDFKSLSIPLVSDNIGR